MGAVGWEKGRGQQQRAKPLQESTGAVSAPLPHHEAHTAHTHTCQLALQEVAEAQEVVVQNEQEDNDGRHEDGDVH